MEERAGPGRWEQKGVGGVGRRRQTKAERGSAHEGVQGYPEYPGGGQRPVRFREARPEVETSGSAAGSDRSGRGLLRREAAGLAPDPHPGLLL